MKHALVDGLVKALGWAGPEELGSGFVRGALPDVGLCARLLTPSRLLDLVMRRSLSAPQLRVFQDGNEIHPARFLDDTANRRGQGIRMANMHRLANLLESGCTMVLDQADVFDPTLEVACRALQWWSHEQVQVNTYLTTQATDGFPLHWDDHEVIVVQLAGEKDWEVRTCPRRAPMYRDSAPNDSPPDEVVWKGSLRAGEVMNIPRGFWHRASRSDLGDGISLHATFGISKRTGVHWLTWLADNSRRVEAFRHDLDRNRRSGQAEDLIEAITSLTRDYAPDSFLDAREAEHAVGRHIPMLDFLGADVAVVCIASFEPQVRDRADGAIEVLVAGRKLTFAAAARPALDALLSGHPVDLADLASTTGIDVTQLANVLLKEKICAPLTQELSSGYTGLVTPLTSSRPLTA